MLSYFSTSAIDEEVQNVSEVNIFFLNRQNDQILQFWLIKFLISNNICKFIAHIYRSYFIDEQTQLPELTQITRSIS